MNKISLLTLLAAMGFVSGCASAAQRCYEDRNTTYEYCEMLENQASYQRAAYWQNVGQTIQQASYQASQNYQAAYNRPIPQPVYIPPAAPVQQFQMPTMKYGNNNTQQAPTYQPYRAQTYQAPPNPVPALNKTNCTTGLGGNFTCTTVGY